MLLWLLRPVVCALLVHRRMLVLLLLQPLLQLAANTNRLKCRGGLAPESSRWWVRSAVMSALRQRLKRLLRRL